MTWMEKFKSEHPKLSEAYIEEEFCPTDGLVSMCPVGPDGEVLSCEECWARQVPETAEGPDRS